MPVRQTERGFDVYDEFTDTYATHISVQESSSAERPKVWVFLEMTSPGLAGAGEASMHLDEEGVDRLIAALQEWRKSVE